MDYCLRDLGFLEEFIVYGGFELDNVSNKFNSKYSL